MAVRCELLDLRLKNTSDFIKRLYGPTWFPTHSLPFEEIDLLQKKIIPFVLQSKLFKGSLFFKDKKRVSQFKQRQNPQDLGLVISFNSIKSNISILNFEILDLKSLDEIKKISTYKIINED